MTATLIESSHSMTKSNRSDILYLARALLGDDVPELVSVTTSVQAIGILRSKLESEPESSKLHTRLTQFLDSHDK